MKKSLFVILLLMMAGLIASCNKNTILEKTELSVIMPNGAPALAQAKLEYDGNKFGNYKATTEKVSDTTLLSAAFVSTDYDIIYAPTNMGAKMYNNNSTYVYAANITWGNVYFATSSTEVFDIHSLNNKTVYLFGQGTINETILNAVLEKNNISINEKIWMPSTNDTKNQLILDPSSIVMIAEPVLSAASLALLAKDYEVDVISLQDLWNDYSGTGYYPQAGVFVNKEVLDLNFELVSSYLLALEESCEYTNTNAIDVANYATELEYGLPSASVLTSAIPRSNINYKTAKESKTALETVFNLNLQLIGGVLPNEGFYAF